MMDRIILAVMVKLWTVWHIAKGVKDGFVSDTCARPRVAGIVIVGSHSIVVVVLACMTKNKRGHQSVYTARD
jgi:hypothetical protein